MSPAEAAITRMQLASRERTCRFPLPEGDTAVLTFPTPLTEETLEMLAELCALMFRGLKRDAVKWSEQERAEAEYASWLPNIDAHLKGAGRE